MTLPEQPLGIARAKINLGLAIVGERDDGYHALRSVFVLIGLADRLTVELAPGAVADSLIVDGEPGLPVEGNLVLKAASLARFFSAPQAPFLAFRLVKRIPLSAGLGGGSSDAAAAIRVAMDAWGVRQTGPALHGLAAAIGADVPFFTTAEPVALVSSIGDQHRPLPGLQSRPGILLVSPDVPISTRDAFAAYRFHRTDTARIVDDLAMDFVGGLDGPGLAAWTDRLADANDLWQAATTVAPRLREIRALIESRLGRRVFMSGSGSTFVGLYPSPQAAVEAGRLLAADLPDPLAGARIAATDDVGPDPHWRFP